MSNHNEMPIAPEQKFERKLADIVNEAAANGANPAVIHMVLHGFAGEILGNVKRRNQPESAPTNVEPIPETPAAN